ncbi:MAG: DNA-3-methyladenine glycosylase 2 family protein [Thiogranum sp.]|jgi:DNA-3-methyladenine glycosylase II|nr:DNA-3-methyladenine glycosylase 2 family protein [Thiogranum sp.]
MEMIRRVRAGERYLQRVDPVLAGLISRHGPCSLMQSPKPHFHTLVWAIINQQLSIKAAQSIERRLLTHLRTEIVEPRHFLRVRDQSLRKCGLSAAKIRYIREAGRQVRCGELDLDTLETVDDTTAAERLMQLPGVGPWTADMLLMFSLGHLDVLPVGDLALRKSIRLHHGMPEDSGAEALRAVAEPWRPYRSVASWYFWAAVD